MTQSDWIKLKLDKEYNLRTSWTFLWIFVFMSYDIYTAVDSIGHAKSTQNHPESVAIALNQGGRVKNDVIIGVGNPDNWWYQDYPPQDYPLVGNPEVGNWRLLEGHRRCRWPWRQREGTCWGQLSLTAGFACTDGLYHQPEKCFPPPLWPRCLCWHRLLRDVHYRFGGRAIGTIWRGNLAQWRGHLAQYEEDIWHNEEEIWHKQWRGEFPTVSLLVPGPIIAQCAVCTISPLDLAYRKIRQL